MASDIPKWIVDKGIILPRCSKPNVIKSCCESPKRKAHRRWVSSLTFIDKKPCSKQRSVAPCLACQAVYPALEPGARLCQLRDSSTSAEGARNCAKSTKTDGWPPPVVAIALDHLQRLTDELQTGALQENPSEPAASASDSITRRAVPSSPGIAHSDPSSHSTF